MLKLLLKRTQKLTSTMEVIKEQESLKCTRICFLFFFFNRILLVIMTQYASHNPVLVGQITVCHEQGKKKRMD